MGKGRPRSVEKGVLGQNSDSLVGALNIQQAPTYYPSEEEFLDPLKYIYKIRPEAEPYGACRIVPPESWKAPFALDLDKFTFPTKTQAIDKLQVRAAACDPDTFELEYNRFLEDHCGKKLRKRVVFEGEDLDLCKFFNGVKRYGGYENVVKEKKWGEVFRFVGCKGKVSECSKHVLCQLYREHLFEYETYNSQLGCEKPSKKCKRRMRGGREKESVEESMTSSSEKYVEVLDKSNSKKSVPEAHTPGLKKRRKNCNGERVKDDKLVKEEDFDQICEQCQSGLHGDVMLLCDRCNKGWHIYCLSPPLKKIPPGNWYCLECFNSDKDSFGFVPGKQFSLETFKRLAERAKRKWFGAACPSRSQIEKKFWEIVDGSVGEVEVMYGNDLDTSIYGSGFPCSSDLKPSSVDVEDWDKYSSSPWNLNNLPKLQGSMLQAVHNNIAGVMVPWLYIGMLFSSFCWHFEDHCFYSINYLHWGEPKCWYTVPGSEAQAFEQVMRKSLPDLFDAQPDLLFQLVTMLNPSVLQENGVPVYTVLQEPGNFVITFPRSYHGGFNFGLNCAEAVNFAPADWFPHGGFGAELYRLYHKAAVLSHEELLYVVAKRGECNDEVLPYLKKELLRVSNREKTWRERLWRYGIVKSSKMSPRNHPEYVGSEEDQTCVICQQYLYLSAVACSCRPSSYVCLEHWDNLCECRPIRHRLLYRHTLAELNDLMLALDNQNFEEATQSSASRKQLLSSDDSNALTKKVRSVRVTHAQLAEEWLLKSLKIVQDQFSNTAFVNALKEAEQFLWAGAEMDPIRDMANTLVDAKTWALDVRNCLSKIENCLHQRKSDLEKVPIGDLQKLLSFSHLPCNEPGHLKLKVYVEEASVLLLEMTSVISSYSPVSMDELEKLYSRATELPVYFEECGKVAAMISSAKVWVDAVNQCVYAKSPTKIEVDTLYKLKLQMSELHVQLPEKALLLDLLEKVEWWQTRCSEMLKGPIYIKELEILLKDTESFLVNIPDLNLLRQLHSDAVSWILRFNEVLVSVHEREDQEIIVEELTHILKDGQMLRVQVDELPIVEEELKRASCRVKALKVRTTKMPMDYIQQLISEANVLQIAKEKLFVDISGLLMAAISWEERVKLVLGAVTQMSEFEEVLRDSEELFLILPSLCDVKYVLAFAKSWLKRSEQFLGGKSSSSLLNVDTLKEIIAQSKHLRVSLEEPKLLQNILKKCEYWEHDASALLRCAESVFEMCDIECSASKGITLRIVRLHDRFKDCTQAGLALGFDLPKIYKVQNAFTKLQWCLKGLCLCSKIPLLEEVERLQEDAGCLSTGNSCNRLINLLIDGARWLKKALVLFPKDNVQKRCKVTDVERILTEAQMIKLPFPMVVAQLEKSIEKHKSWQEQVHLFFGSRSGKQSWSALSRLKELGNSIAFDSLEFDTVTSECRKVEKWIVCCKEVVELLVGDSKPLCGSLLTIKLNLDKSLQVYQNSMGCSSKLPYMCCASESEDQALLACSLCDDRYHIACLGSKLANTKATSEYTCPYCLYMESGAVSRNGCITAIIKKKRPELKMLIELVSAAKDFCIRTEETEMLQQVVEQAHQCQTFLTEIMDFVLCHVDDDLGFISRKLTTCMKAVAMAGVTDQATICGLELALTRYAWKVRTKKLLLSSQRPTIQQVQRLLKDGSALNIPSGDHFMKKLTEVKSIGSQWCDKAKKVASDCGELGLDEVFKLIAEGDNLPIQFEKELKLLRARSVLYCICRKPYDNRAMIACDTCDEWYHFDCINLRGTPPKTYHCPACKPLAEELSFSSHMCHEKRSTDADDAGPQTPSPPRSNSSTKRRNKSITRLHEQMVVATDLSDVLRHSSGIDQLWWRTRKPLKRTCRKRVEFDSLSPTFHL